MSFVVPTDYRRVASKIHLCVLKWELKTKVKSFPARRRETKVDSRKRRNRKQMVHGEIVPNVGVKELKSGIKEMIWSI